MSETRWFGDVPERWDVVPARALFEEVDERGHADEPLLSVTISRGVIEQRALLAGGSKKDNSNEDKSAYKLVQPGDVAYNKMRAWQGAVGLSRYRGIVSPAYVVLRPREPEAARYFHYLLRTPRFATEAQRWSYGISSDQWSLRPEHFKRIRFPLPSAAEQAAIVRFLDDADQRIRRAIEAKEKLIALLNEQTQAIVQRLITAGPHSQAPTRATPFGDIPEHWDVLSLKRVLARLIDCEHKTAPAVDSSDYRVVRTSAVREGELRLAGTYCTTEEAFREWTRRDVPAPDDVIFTREAPAGEACVVPHDMALCLGQRTVLMKLRPDRYDARYLVHMIYAGPPVTTIRLASQGSTVDHFNMDDIRALPVFAPPLEEQQAIVRHIDHSTAGPRAVAREAEREIHLLREYRTRLIADAVMGKLDVRTASTEPAVA